jgi:hypothetical protein
LTYFADGRLNATGTLPLAELSGAAQPIDLPVPADVTPFWLVPPDVSRFTVAATADTGINLDINYNSFEPEDYAANVNDTATVNVNAHQVSPGEWAADVGQVGPFGHNPAPAGHLNISASAVGQLFDPDLTSTTGDIWALGLDPGADAALASLMGQAHALLRSGTVGPGSHLTRAAGGSGQPASATAQAVFTGPVTLGPGQSTTITVTITPSGYNKGTVVHAHLYIDTWNGFTDAGDELIDLPYTYQVG